MGEEIRSCQYVESDYQRFRQQLEVETEQLAQWFADEAFSTRAPVAGFELEAWLLDPQLRPAPLNEAFLSALADPLATPELASFNIELNSTPRPIRGHVFSAMHAELVQIWRRCKQVAQPLDCCLAMIGILPTVQDDDLHLANMSSMQRYRALNREVVHLRKGKPLVLDINGEEHLKVTRRNVMLESVATSFQIHMQLEPRLAKRGYNAGLILAAPMVALCANSPYLFGKDLWAETRIPVFEQAVAVGGYQAARFGPIRRITFGSGYVRESIMELFAENLAHYPILLPEEFDQPHKNLPHLRLHNGTIWRWNRPLLGFDDDGQPHLRIEHRVVPAGPSIIDSIANAAFYYGALMILSTQADPPEQQLEFDKARDNFYKAARMGMHVQLNWLKQQQLAASEVLQQLLTMAHQGLTQLGVADDDRHLCLDVIEARIASGMNGTTWQRAFVAKYGKDFSALTEAYLERQESGKAVHEWTV